MTLQYLIHLANYSDGVLYALGLLLLVALAVIVDRFWFLRRTIARGHFVVRTLTRYHELDRQSLHELVHAAGELPEAALLECAAQHFGKVKGEALSNRLEEQLLVTAPRLDRRLWLLDTIITLAPLLGLFGTILGMFHAFSVLAQPGHAPTAVTGGVADALVATASGLFIAMLGLLAYNAFNNQVRLIIHQMDSVKTMLLNRLDGQPMLLNGDNGDPAAATVASVAQNFRAVAAEP